MPGTGCRWLTVEWLPKYTSELKGIEVVWGNLKARHLALRTSADPDHLETAIHHAVITLNAQRNRDLFASQRVSA